jgi:hypothetical protein
MPLHQADRDYHKQYFGSASSSRPREAQGDASATTGQVRNQGSSYFEPWDRWKEEAPFREGGNGGRNIGRNGGGNDSSSGRDERQGFGQHEEGPTAVRFESSGQSATLTSSGH